MSDIRFNQWLHQSGTGGVSQVASGAVGVGTTNPLADFYVRGDAQITGILTAGHIAMGSSITFGDDDRAYFGDGTDLQIYHSGSHSFIQDTGTGDLKIRSSNVRIEDTSGNLIINAAPTTAFLYSSGNAKLGTAGWGAQVNGIFKVLDATDSSGSTNKLSIGTGNDFNLFHDSSHSYISNTTGHLTIQNNVAGHVINLQPKAGANGVITRYEGASELYYNGNKKFETTNTGAVVTGIITATSRVSLGNNTTNAVDLEFGTNRGSAGDTLANINWKWNNTYVAQIRGMAGSDTTNKDDAHLNFYTAAAGSLVERLRIDSAGRVMIGNTAAASFNTSTNQLVLGNGVGNNGMVIYTGASHSGNLIFNDVADGTFQGGFSYKHGSGASDNSLKFYANASERLRITSTGDLSLRSTTQNAYLGLTANSTAINTTLGSTTGTNPRLYLKGVGNGQSDAGDVFIGSGTGGIVQIRSAELIKFEVNSDNSTAEALRIDSSGRLLVNTTTGFAGDNTMIISGESPSGGTYDLYDGQLLITSNETSGAVNTGGVIQFYGHDGGSSRGFGSIRCLKENGTSGNHNAYMAFLLRVNGGSPTERLRIRSDGEIVINHTQTSTPLNNTFISIWDANSDSSAIDASGVSKNYAMINLHNYGTGIQGDTTGIGFGAGSAFSYTKGSIAFQRTGGYGLGDLVFLTNNDSDTTMVNDGDERMRITKEGDIYGPGGGRKNWFDNGSFDCIGGRRANTSMDYGNHHAYGWVTDRWMSRNSVQWSRSTNVPTGKGFSYSTLTNGAGGQLVQAVELPDYGDMGVFTPGSYWCVSFWSTVGANASTAAFSYDLGVTYTGIPVAMGGTYATTGETAAGTSTGTFNRYYKVYGPMPSSIISGAIAAYWTLGFLAAGYTTGFQLERVPTSTSKPTPYEHVHPAVTTARCRRYCYQNVNSRLMNGYKRHDGNIYWAVQFPVPPTHMPAGSNQSVPPYGIHLHDGGLLSNFQSVLQNPGVNSVSISEFDYRSGRFLINGSTSYSSTHVTVPAWESQEYEIQHGFF